MATWRLPPLVSTARYTAPEPPAGHLVGGPFAAAGGGGAGGGAAGFGGGGAAGRGTEPEAPPPAAAPTSWGAAAGAGAPMTNRFWQPGQRTCLPVASSGTCI